MFVLADIEDTIRVEPRFFVKPAAIAIEDQINAKYANRVCGNLTRSSKMLACA